MATIPSGLVEDVARDAALRDKGALRGGLNKSIFTSRINGAALFTSGRFSFLERPDGVITMELMHRQRTAIQIGRRP